MKTEYFESIQEVGFELASVSDALHAIDLGMSIIDENENYIDGEDESEKPVTTDELIESVQTAFKTGYKVFAVIPRPSGTKVVPAKATTLQSSFYVGQEVYTMEGNKIRKATIELLSLSNKGTLDKDYIKDAYLKETAKNLYYTIGFMFNNSMPSYPDFDKLKAIKEVVEKELSNNYVVIKLSDEKYDSARKRTFEEIFATKEELVKHLMEE